MSGNVDSLLARWYSAFELIIWKGFSLQRKWCVRINTTHKKQR